MFINAREMTEHLSELAPRQLSRLVSIVTCIVIAFNLVLTMRQSQFIDYKLSKCCRWTRWSWETLVFFTEFYRCFGILLRWSTIS